MARKLFVGNLPWSVNDDDLEDELATLGIRFSRAEVVYNRVDGNRSRGFGFVHFDSDQDCEVARVALVDHEVKGRCLVVDVANERQQDRDRRGERGRGGDAPRRGRGRSRGPWANDDV